MSQLSETAFPERLEQPTAVWSVQAKVEREKALQALGIKDSSSLVDKLDAFVFDQGRLDGQSAPDLPTAFTGQMIPQFEHWVAAMTPPTVKLSTMAYFSMGMYAAALCPLEVARVRQISDSRTWPSYIPRPRVMSVGGIISSIANNEGVYYLIRSFPAHAAVRLLRMAQMTMTELLVTERGYWAPENTVLRTAYFAVLSSVCFHWATQWLEQIAVRSAHPAGNRLYGSFYDMGQRIYVNEGYSLFFLKGLGPSMARDTVTWVALQASWEKLCPAAFRLLDNGKADPLGKRTGRIAAACGAVAGGLSAIITQPLDVIATRVLLSSARPDLSPRAAFDQVMRRDGVPGLFRGAAPRFLWWSAIGAIYFQRQSKVAIVGTERHVIEAELTDDPRVRHLRAEYYRSIVPPGSDAAKRVASLEHDAIVKLSRNAAV